MLDSININFNLKYFYLDIKKTKNVPQVFFCGQEESNLSKFKLKKQIASYTQTKTEFKTDQKQHL